MDYPCEFCNVTYPTSYMIREHVQIAHKDARTILTLRLFMAKVEAFMEKTEARLNELSDRIDKLPL
jgi:hypothetical protein